MFIPNEPLFTVAGGSGPIRSDRGGSYGGSDICPVLEVPIPSQCYLMSGGGSPAWHGRGEAMHVMCKVAYFFYYFSCTAVQI